MTEIYDMLNIFIYYKTIHIISYVSANKAPIFVLCFNI